MIYLPDFIAIDLFTFIKKMKYYHLFLFISLSFLFGACTGNSTNEEGELKVAERAWTVLFDGKSTEALRGYGLEIFPEGIWEVEDGLLVAQTDTLNIDLVSKERFADFELEYEWAVDTAANSGVFFHVQEVAPMESGNGNSPNWMNNFEIQILDDINFYDTVAVRSAGSLYDLIAPINKKLKPIGEFNTASIVCKKGEVTHILNGQKVLSFKIGSKELNAKIAESKFSENPKFGTDTEGHIMFQHHGQKVYFKNIRVREF